MPLSDHEQKLLQEIENALYADDPKFFMQVASSRGGVYTTFALKRLCVFATISLGVFLLIGGIFLPKYEGVPVACICGFIAVLTGIFLLSRYPRIPSTDRTGGGVALFTQKMEERFRKRFT